jgi:hypothetical protein
MAPEAEMPGEREDVVFTPGIDVGRIGQENLHRKRVRFNPRYGRMP